MNKINVFDYLKNNDLAFVKISLIFRQNLTNKILNRYGNIKSYCKNILKIPKATLEHQLKLSPYFKFDRLLKMTEEFNLTEDEIYNEISAFFAKGSNTSKEVILSKELLVDEFFVEGYALYLAEGDNGSNGIKKPRKFRFTNSEVNVINHMIKWVRLYFPNNYFYVSINNPRGNAIDFESVQNCINHDNIKFKEESYNKVIKYRIHLDSAIIIDLILAIEDKIKELCSQDRNLAAAYIRGMMIGEGTAYFNKSRYVRIEMRNEKEIKYLHKLLTLLSFDCKPVLRSNRHNMWSLYIGAKQLSKFAQEVGFGVHQERQQILEQGVNKVLRVNQYC